ncbi:MAG: hypothetical protein HQK76_11310 [Desulfobacterales bacterium]|nr:hypothetical protein [Desulfobacterales bacterium]
MESISIVKINKNSLNELDEFLMFPLEIYEDKKMIEFNIPKTKSMVTETGDFDLFLAKSSSGKVQGRMVLGVNPAITDENGCPYGYVGIFDVVENFEIFKQMLDYARQSFTGKNYILFPLFKSTWYPYRFTSQGFHNYHYFMEFPEQEYYAEFTKKYGVEEAYKYIASISYDIDKLIENNKKSYEKALSCGISFRNIDLSRPREEFKIVYDLTVDNYNDQTNRFFTKISFEEFYSFYEGVIKILDSEFLTFGCNSKGEPVSYGFSPPDYTPIIEGKGNKIEGVIIKTGATDSNYRKMGIYGGITYLHGLESKKRNYKYAIGGYTDINLFTHKVMPKDLIWKEHELYKLKV